MHEDTLMDIMSDYNSKLFLPDLSLQKIFSCVVPKVQMWNCFDDNQKFLWAYKWNGIKAEFMCIGENAYIWPDAGEIYTDTCTVLDKTSGAGDNPLTLIRNMCIVELMPDSIIIVEVVAISYFDTVNNPEPIINVRILNFLCSILYTRAGTPRITIGRNISKYNHFIAVNYRKRTTHRAMMA
uniref:LEF-4 n=1 Tax=Nilaparvata lugens endogenous nudivirus TaxID=1487700 RepID=X5GF10_9VIRU|nr:LEF-4 [Nilaparvata lugens endogenous nudivirus]